MATSPALIFENVNRTFGEGDTAVKALNDISFSAQPGKICGLIGPDGAGKTTAMRLAAGLLLPDSGKLMVHGIDVVASPLQTQAAIGYMPQHFGLYEDLSVQENLDLYADLQGVELQKRKARYEELMHMTKLAPFSRRLAGRLSGGMKQKLGLACSLVRTPRLLLLDEPTAGVDPVSRRELWAIIYRLVKQEGISVLLSTAYLDEAERCDDIVLMHAGEVLDQGSPGYFSATMQGRTFHINAPSLRKRILQRRLGSAPGVLDAVIDNENIRVITDESVTPGETAGPVATATPAFASAFNDVADLQVKAVAPVFEDAFVARLKHHQDAMRSELKLRAKSQAPDAGVIEVNSVQKRFGEFYAVKGISFSVSCGEVFGLLGANGAGKSTTFRMLCGLLPATAGELTVAGHDLRRAAADARSRLGYMAQRFSLYADLTVSENLKFFANAYGLNRTQRKQRIGWALETFDLAEYADIKSGDLPLGFKQRMALAVALLHEPDILFLDEPTSGVDPLARREFWQRINALAESGITVLVTTHFMAEADYCDRLIIMADGEELAQGTPAELKTRFRTAETPNPSMEDAFIGLIEDRKQPGITS
jgi:ABC-2 type transport system ATP-binding protein